MKNPLRMKKRSTPIQPLVTKGSLENELEPNVWENLALRCALTTSSMAMVRSPSRNGIWPEGGCKSSWMEPEKRLERTSRRSELPKLSLNLEYLGRVGLNGPLLIATADQECILGFDLCPVKTRGKKLGVAQLN